MNNTELLQKLYNKIGITAEGFRSICMKQVYIDYWLNISMYIAFFIWIPVAYYLITRGIERVAENYNAEIEDHLMVLIGGFVSFIFILGCIFSISDMITMIYNPEYYAIKQLMKK